MKMKFYTEMAYLFGIVWLALGTAFMERANYGMSMVVAPAYLIYLKVSEYLTWFTFGMAEYCFQAFLLILLGLVIGQYKRKFIFSFVTAFIYGNVLDLMMFLVSLIKASGTAWNIAFFIIGMVVCAMGVSMIFHTYISPEAYELFVKEISTKYNKSIPKVKTAYDCCSCLLAIIMSFAFMGFGHFEGVKFGTIICALVNGSIIGLCSRFFESKLEFTDGLKMKAFFQK